MKREMHILSAILVLVTLATGVAACGAASAETGVVLPAPETSTELSQSEVEALGMALDDEYKAWTTYQAVIAKFGDVRPFSSIIRAEESHIEALETLFERYGLDVPENEWVGRVPEFDTVNDACHAGVEAEIENAALYDRLFPMVEHEDIFEVFHKLRDASQEKHLPAFERCAR